MRHFMRIERKLDTLVLCVPQRHSNKELSSFFNDTNFPQTHSYISSSFSRNPRIGTLDSEMVTTFSPCCLFFLSFFSFNERETKRNNSCNCGVVFKNSSIGAERILSIKTNKKIERKKLFTYIFEKKKPV